MYKEVAEKKGRAPEWSCQRARSMDRWMDGVKVSRMEWKGAGG